MDKTNYSPWNLFSESCKKYSHNTMVIYNNIKLKYCEMFDMVTSIAELFEELELEFRICGIYLPNSEWFIACIFSLSKIKRVVVPLSYQLFCVQLV